MDSYSYNNLISIENLFQAWDKFKKGKRKKIDVGFFELSLETNLFDLHEKVKSGQTFNSALAQHQNYFSSFYINLVKVGEASGTSALKQEENGRFLKSSVGFGMRITTPMTARATLGPGSMKPVR